MMKSDQLKPVLEICSIGHLDIQLDIQLDIYPIVQLFFILYDLDNMDIVQLDLDICPIVQLDVQCPIKSIGHCPNPTQIVGKTYLSVK